MKVALAILVAAAMAQISTRAATNPIGNTGHSPILGSAWYCEKIKPSDFSLTPNKFDLIAKDPTREDAMIDLLAAVLNHARKGNNYDAPGLQLENKSGRQPLIILVSPQGAHAPIINPTDEQTSALIKSIGKRPIYLRFPIDDLGLPIVQFWVEALRNCYGDVATKNIYSQAGTPLRRRPHHTDKAKYNPSMPKNADKQGYQFGIEDGSTDITSTALLPNAKLSQVKDMPDHNESMVWPPSNNEDPLELSDLDESKFYVWPPPKNEDPLELSDLDESKFYVWPPPKNEDPLELSDLDESKFYVWPPPKNEDPLELSDLDESKFSVRPPRIDDEVPKYRKKSSARDTVQSSGQSEGWKISSRNNANEGQSQPQYQLYQQQQQYQPYQQQPYQQQPYQQQPYQQQQYHHQQ